MSILEETVKNESNAKGTTEKMKYDEKFEGYYVVTTSALNIRSVPDGKKPDTIVKCILNGEKPRCDGNYVVIDGKRWLHVDINGVFGFACDRFLAKL